MFSLRAVVVVLMVAGCLGKCVLEQVVAVVLGYFGV